MLSLKKIGKAIILLTPWMINLHAQPLDNYRDENIKSLLFQKNGRSTFVIELNAATFDVSFDYLGEGYKRFYYTFKHCDRDWNLSNVFFNMYAEGTEKTYLSKYDISFNTMEPYKHFETTFPAPNQRLKVSGNYVWQLYDQTNRLVAQQRFVVVRPLAAISGVVQRPFNVLLNETHQELNLQASMTNNEMIQNYLKLEMRVVKNFDWHQSISKNEPTFFDNGKLKYTNGSFVFPGGNESRNFTTRYLRVNGYTTENIKITDTLVETFLMPDMDRSAQPYTFYEELNGMFQPHTADFNDQLSADYTMVNFTLDAIPENSTDKIYVYDGYNGFQLDDRNLMFFDEVSGVYRFQTLLKQGYYNYNYVVKKEDGKIKFSEFDGNFYNTRNEYDAFLYYRFLNSRMDEVLGSVKIFSQPN